MQRTKVFAASAALVSAALAAVFLAGGASAATWHLYDGDMFPGHAYALQVPADSESVEFLFQGSETGSASIGVYEPGGDKVGYYALAPSLTAASIANPNAGRYVVYVYDVTDGALTVRVSAEDAPETLDLSEVELIREETKIGTFEQGKLDQVITAELKHETVFVTLLYQGSAKDLDATVSSAKGAVVTITDESATAFSPGVWTSLKGARTFDAANLEGVKYTVEAHAEQFEGTMTLTTLGLKLEMPSTIPHAPHARHVKPNAPPAPTMPVERPAFDPATAHFALTEGVPVAFEALGATLTFAAPVLTEEQCDDEETKEEEACPVGYGLISLYAPDDSLLQVIALSEDESTVTVELPTKGEYVAYARVVEGESILVKVDGVTTAPTIRELATEVETIMIEEYSGLGHRTSSPVEIAHAPLEMSLRFLDGIGTLSSLELENEKGTVATASALAVIPGADMFQWVEMTPENFAAGLHTLAISGVYEGSIELTSVHYLRDSTVEAEPVEAEADHEHDSVDPLAPPMPIVPYFPRVFDALPELW